MAIASSSATIGSSDSSSPTVVNNTPATTDENIHLIASLLCAKLDIDYIAAYVQAYDPAAEELEWLRSLSSNQSLLDETVIPECAGPNDLAFMLSDWYPYPQKIYQSADWLPEQFHETTARSWNLPCDSERINRLSSRWRCIIRLRRHYPENHIIEA